MEYLRMRLKQVSKFCFVKNSLWHSISVVYDGAMTKQQLESFVNKVM